MTSKTEVTLEHFYIFNGTYAKKEGEVSTRNSTVKYFRNHRTTRRRYTREINNSPCTPFPQEEKKILYYYPERDVDIQIKNIGLSEAIIKFAE